MNILVVIQANIKTLFGKLQRNVTLSEWELFAHIDVLDWKYDETYNLIHITIDPNFAPNFK